MKKIGLFSFTIWLLLNLTLGIFLTINLVGFARAQDEEFTYTLTVNTVGSGSVTKDPDQSSYFFRTRVKLTAVADLGWSFSGWSEDLTGSSNPETIRMLSNMTVNATFTQNEYTLTVSTVGSGSVDKSPDQATYHYGDSVTLTATPSFGWMFSGWSGDLSGSDMPESITMDGNKAVTATFAEIPTYDLTIDVSGSGSTVPSDGVHSYIEGIEVEVYSIPDSGWILDHWILDTVDVGSASFYNVTMDADHILTAVFRDITPPTIEIISPQIITYSTTSVDLNFTVNEVTDWIGYSLDGAENTSIFGNTTLTGLSEGPHSVIVYANDTAGNTGESHVVYFSVDTTPPTITIHSPISSTYSSSVISLIFSVSEDTSWIGYRLDAQNNITISGNTTISGLSEGSHNIVVYANDTVGNMGKSATIYFVVYVPPVDITPPTITITSPQETNYSTSEVTLNFNIDESVSWRAYSLDGEDNVTIAGNTVLSGLSEGEHTIKIFARDNAGNTGVSNTVSFRVDTTPPIITLTSPEETTYSTPNVFLEFTLTEEATWIGYSLDGEDNVTITGDSMLTGLSEGSHIIVVFATDSAGNMGASSTVQFTISTPPVDTTPPTILITSPENTTYEVSEVSLDFSVNENTSWIGYSLDGQNNITVSENTILSGLFEGPHSVVVFANDTAGNTGASDVVQFTVSTSLDDTTPPTILITSPENTTYNTNKISLKFTVNEEPSLKFYSLDGKANVTVVDSTVLYDLSDGEHHLIMYAEDSTGNTAASEVIIFTIATKSDQVTELWIVGVIWVVGFTGITFSIYLAYDRFKNRRTLT